jgi:hypothetical protein
VSYLRIPSKKLALNGKRFPQPIRKCTKKCLPSKIQVKMWQKDFDVFLAKIDYPWPQNQGICDIFMYLGFIYLFFAIYA